MLNCLSHCQVGEQIDVGNVMQQTLLNVTRILEKNAKIYISIIVGIVLCLMLFVAEAVHVQKLAAALGGQDQVLLKQAIEPISQIYRWVRVACLVLGFVWSSLEYTKTKKQLGL